MSRQTGGITGKLFELCDRLGFVVKKKIKQVNAGEESTAGATLLEKKVGSKDFKASLLRAKTRFAADCENSAILSFLRRFTAGCMRLSCRSISAFCISFALSASAVYFLKYILYDSYPTYGAVAMILVMFAVAVPFAFSEKSIYGLLSESLMFSDITRSAYVSDDIKYSEPLSCAGVLLFAGMSAGILSYFTGVFMIPQIIAAACFIALIFVYPEKGLVITLLLVPFLGLFASPSITLAALVLLLFTAYGFKYFRGKRMNPSAKLNYPFVVLIAGVLLSSIPFFDSSFKPALLTAALMLGFPLAVCLLWNDRTISSSVYAIAASSCFIAAIGLAQYFLGEAPLDWLDTELFTAISGRAVSLFGNPNMLGAYLTLVFPFGLHLLCSGNGFRERFLGFASVVLIIGCGVATWSRSCWVGLFVGFAFYAFIMTPRSLVIVPCGMAVAGGACVLFSDTIGKRFMSLFSIADHANSYRVSVWNGAVRAFRECFFTGVGAGDVAFRNIFLQFCNPGTESAPHSHSIYLQLGISGGIITLVAFICFCVSVMRHTLRVTAASPAIGLRSETAAAISSVLAMAVIGTVDNVFYNYRIMFLFFFVAGFAVASANRLKYTVDCSKSSFNHSGQASDYLE